MPSLRLSLITCHEQKYHRCGLDLEIKVVFRETLTLQISLSVAPVPRLLMSSHCPCRRGPEGLLEQRPYQGAEMASGAKAFEDLWSVPIHFTLRKDK